MVGAKTTLDRLTSLRAAAALGVFMVHLSQYDVWRLPLNLSSEGYVGVGFFFTLSGFILVIAAPASDSPRAFYRRRFARIYPAYPTMVIVALVVPVVAASRGPLEVLTSVTLTQSWFPASNSIVYGATAVSWSLSCEAAFYAVFPFALAWLIARDRRFRWSFAICWYLVAAAISVAAVRSHMQFATTAVYVSPMLRFGEFALGLVAGLEIAEGWRPADTHRGGSCVPRRAHGWDLASPHSVPASRLRVRSAVPGPNRVRGGSRLDRCARIAHSAVTDIRGPGVVLFLPGAPVDHREPQARAGWQRTVRCAAAVLGRIRGSGRAAPPRRASLSAASSWASAAAAG